MREFRRRYNFSKDTSVDMSEVSGDSVFLYSSSLLAAIDGLTWRLENLLRLIE